MAAVFDKDLSFCGAMGIEHQRSGLCAQPQAIHKTRLSSVNHPMGQIMASSLSVVVIRVKEGVLGGNNGRSLEIQSRNLLSRWYTGCDRSIKSARRIRRTQGSMKTDGRHWGAFYCRTNTWFGTRQESAEENKGKPDTAMPHIWGQSLFSYGERQGQGELR
ncbi:hypothetical protein K438DRAFT_1775645 [Mycena galopus ATCC 62051]|nr:hypothetical protein K438DRAFT_1775645 [Mycena galopus ATCC 62051]